MVSTTLEPTFCIDNVVQYVFSRHPLWNCITWDYYCSGDFSDRVVGEAFYGPDEGHAQNIISVIRNRHRTPEAQVANFWQLYGTYMAPSEETTKGWVNDLLMEILDLRQTYGPAKGEEPPHEDVFTRGADLIQAMAREFPDETAALNDASDRGGLEAAVSYYVDLLPDGNTVRVIDWQNPFENNRFHVLSRCVRQITQFTQNRRAESSRDTIPQEGKDFLKRILQASGRGGQRPPRFYMYYYPIVGTDLNEHLKNQYRVIKRDVWGRAEMQEVIHNVQKYANVREALTRLLVYSGIDPGRGIDILIDRCNEEVDGKEWSPGLFRDMEERHTEHPVSTIPWRCEGSDLPEHKLERVNFNLFNTLLDRVPVYQNPRRPEEAPSLNQIEEEEKPTPRGQSEEYGPDGFRDHDAIDSSGVRTTVTYSPMLWIIPAAAVGVYVAFFS